MMAKAGYQTIAAGHGKGFTVELIEALSGLSVYVNGERLAGPTHNRDKAVSEYTTLLRQYTGIK
jgi:hypothetical protein